MTFVRADEVERRIWAAPSAMLSYSAVLPLACSPRTVETAHVDLPVADHAHGAGREPVAFRIEKDCWSCR